MGDEQLIKQVHADLKRHEGCLLKAYQDTEGVWTIGYGHTRNVFEGLVISQLQAEAFLLSDMFDAHMEAKNNIKFFEKLDPVRKGILINMCVNLGWPRLKQFKATLAHIENGKYWEASEHMLASKWAKQVKGRAIELAARMATGKIAPEHLIIVT
jgi:lysozyme